MTISTEELLARAKAYHDAAEYLKNRKPFSSLQSDADLHVARKLKDMGNDFIRLTKET